MSPSLTDWVTNLYIHLQAARTNSREAYKMYTQIVDESNTKCNLRGQLRFKVRQEKTKGRLGLLCSPLFVRVGSERLIIVDR